MCTVCHTVYAAAAFQAKLQPLLIVQTKPRLDLAKLKDDDDDITGGYILEYRHGDNFKDEPTINSTMFVLILLLCASQNVAIS